MKKLSFYLLMLLVVPAFLFTGCKDDETTDPAFDILKTYLIDENMDIDKIILYHDDAAGTDIKFVTGAPVAEDLDAFLASHYILDIRGASDFAAGHIDGAINVAFADILTAAADAGGTQILIACASGQTACYAAALLRLYGYPKAQALKWGMSGWNAATAGPWNGNVGNTADGHANWTFDAAPANVVYDAPDFDGASDDGATLLQERVEAVVAAGFKVETNANVLVTPADYFINNYFSETDYTGFGHINGAVRILPLLLADESVMGLDPDGKVVTYCYTGQTSAVVTAYLNVMGYDAYSLLFGMNGMWNTNPAFVGNQWGFDSNPKDLPLVQ